MDTLSLLWRTLLSPKCQLIFRGAIVGVLDLNPEFVLARVLPATAARRNCLYQLPGFTRLRPQTLGEWHLPGAGWFESLASWSLVICLMSLVILVTDEICPNTLQFWWGTLHYYFYHSIFDIAGAAYFECRMPRMPWLTQKGWVFGALCPDGALHFLLGLLNLYYTVTVHIYKSWGYQAALQMHEPKQFVIFA